MRLGRWALATLLLLAGLAKLSDGSAANAFIERVLLVRADWLSTLTAIFEIVLALWLVSGMAAGRAALVTAIVFAGFALAHLLAVDDATDTSCGCLGDIAGTATWTTWHWLSLNVAATAVAILVATRAQPKQEATDEIL